MLRVNALPLFILFILVLTGCGTGYVTAPEEPGLSTNRMQDSSTHRFWGIYDVFIDPVDGPSVVPLRTLEGHLNATGFLEVAPCASCIVVSNPNNLGDKEWMVDVQIRHPFIGLDKYTGFDVRGIVMFDPTFTFPSSGLEFPDPDFPAGGALINPDGYTDIFNPLDYAPGSQAWPAWEYQMGKFATPVAPVATLNPYKEYGTENERRYFGCSMADTQTYHLRFPADGPLHFGYAIDANWAPALADPPVVPDDFPVAANRPEPFFVSLLVHENTLWSESGVGGGGSIKFILEVHDHQDPRLVADGGTIEGFKWEIPGMTGWVDIIPEAWVEVPSTGDPYVAYSFTEAPIPDVPGIHKMLIAIIDEEPSIIGTNSTAYILSQLSIASGETCWSPGVIISGNPKSSYDTHLNNAHAIFTDDTGALNVFYADEGDQLCYLVYQDSVVSDEVLIADKCTFNINALPDESGGVHLLYADDHTITGGNIVYRYFSSGGILGPATILSADSHSNQFEDTLAVAPDGTMLAVWMDSKTQPDRRLCAVYFNGTSWSPEMNLKTCYLPHGWVSPTVVADSNSIFHIVHCDDDPMDLHYRQFDHGSLGSDQTIVSGNWKSTGPVLSIDATDRLYLTFQDTRTGSRRGYFMMRDPLSGLWTSEIDIVGYNHANIRYQNFLLPDGRLAVNWIDYRLGERRLYSKVFDPYLSESEVQALPDDELDAIIHTIKNQNRFYMDEYGTLHCVWNDYRAGNWWQLVYSHCTP